MKEIYKIRLKEKENNIPMGYIGFRLIQNQHPDLEGAVEIGYILDTPYWGKGYVSEALKACIEEGFERFKFKSITATILPSNQASIAVVKKMGFELMGQYRIHDIPHEVFRVRPDVELDN